MDAPGADEDESSSLVALPVDFVKVLLKSVGVVLTDVQDIELRYKNHMYVVLKRISLF